MRSDIGWAVFWFENYSIDLALAACKAVGIKVEVKETPIEYIFPQFSELGG